MEVERIRLELSTIRDVVLVDAMAYVGLRPGEALALSDDSITENVIVVDRNWTYGELKLTKTERRLHRGQASVLAGPGGAPAYL